MKWRKYTIYTTTEAEDLISMMLMEHGVEGVQIEDNVPLSEADTRGMFIDILPELPADDGTSRVSFFLHLAEEGESSLTSHEEYPGAEAVVSKDHENKDCTDQTDHNIVRSASAAAEDHSYTISDRCWTEAEIAELLHAVEAELVEMRAYAEIGEGCLEIGETEDTDWRDNWKQYFKPIVSGSFLIKPTWEEIPEELREGAASGELKVIEIDPGTAFGTGSHETTQLCLAGIEKYIRSGDRVMDIGTGSGILGIAALKQGASFCLATELDGMCAPSIRENLAYNKISEVPDPDDLDAGSFELLIGNIIGDADIIEGAHAASPNGYDVAIANILAPVIILLAAPGEMDPFVRPGGIFITSGIIDEKEAAVVEAFHANPAWEILEVLHKGEWVSVVARRV